MWECKRSTKAWTLNEWFPFCCLPRYLRLCKSVLVAVEFNRRPQETSKRWFSTNLQIQPEHIPAVCSWSTTNLNTWNRYVHEVLSVTSRSHFHPPKLYVQAEHYSSNYQGVVTSKISGDDGMPSLLSMRTTIRKLQPCNVKTIEWGQEFLPTFLAECDFENFTVRKLSVMSYAIFCRVYFGLDKQGSVCALWGIQLEEVDHGIRSFAFCERPIVRRRYGHSVTVHI